MGGRNPSHRAGCTVHTAAHRTRRTKQLHTHDMTCDAAAGAHCDAHASSRGDSSRLYQRHPSTAQRRRALEPLRGRREDGPDEGRVEHIHHVQESNSPRDGPSATMVGRGRHMREPRERAQTVVVRVEARVCDEGNFNSRPSPTKTARRRAVSSSSRTRHGAPSRSACGSRRRASLLRGST